MRKFALGRHEKAHDALDRRDVVMVEAITRISRVAICANTYGCVRFRRSAVPWWAMDPIGRVLAMTGGEFKISEFVVSPRRCASRLLLQRCLF